MVVTCSAFGCSNRANPASEVSFHSYPHHDAALLEKWKRANPRKDFEPTKYTKICSLHFHPHDFIEVSEDTNTTRKKKRNMTLLRRGLKSGAVPSIFPNAPVYLSTDKKAPRATAATSSERMEREQRDLDERIGAFHQADSIFKTALSEIQRRLEQEVTRPTGFQTAIEGGKLCIYMLEVQPQCRVSCYICLAEDLTVTYGANGLPLKSSLFSDLLSEGKVSTLSQLVNLMSRIKNWTEDFSKDESAPESKVSSLLDAAQELLEEAAGLTDNRTVSFALEQLKLSRKPPCARRYSEDLLVFSYLICYVTAAVARKFVQNRRCDSCRELLLEQEEMLPLEADWVPTEALSFFEQINRGGLCQPTELAFALATHCWSIFEEIRRKDPLRRAFLTVQHQQQVFCGLVDEMADEEVFLESFMQLVTCTHGHDVKAGLARAFCNCMMKNLAKELSNREGGRKRKITKLSGHAATS